MFSGVTESLFILLCLGGVGWGWGGGARGRHRNEGCTIKSQMGAGNGGGGGIVTPLFSISNYSSSV